MMHYAYTYLLLIFVEDVAVIRDLIMDCLQEHEYEAVGAATAEDAMQRLASGPAPSLAVTDIDLGAGRSGLEFADWPHERWPELNVIFANGRPDWLNGRAFDPRESCLSSPFSLSKLVELVDRSRPSPMVGRP